MTGIGFRLERASLALGGRRVLRALDLDVAPGARVLLLGANGAGKTQLLKLLAGERWPTPRGGSAAGHGARRYCDAGGRDCPLPELLPRIALVGGERQDTYLRYDWDFAVQRLVGTGCHGSDRPLTPLTRAEAGRVRGALRRLDLWRLRRRRFLSLSYGERRLVLLARALAGRPRLLLLDEPYNGLDRRCRALFDRELRRLARTRLTIVLAAHRAADAPRLFARVLVLERGRLAYDGARAAVPGAWLTETRPARADRVRARGRLAATAGARGVPARPLPAARAVHAARPVAGTGAPLVVLKNVDLYRDYRPVLRGLDWRLMPGEHWAVLGANGSGKSTLLRCLYGELPAALGGELQRRGHARGTPLSEWRQRLGLVSPELQADYFERLPLEELVASGRRASIGLAWPASAGERALARAALRRTGLKVDPRRDARDLSYGQRRLALVARALLRRPEALLLDEPLTGLDAPTRARMLRLLDRLAAEGVQLVVAAHHAADLPDAINRVLRLRAGRAFVGTPTRRRPVRGG